MFSRPGSEADAKRGHHAVRIVVGLAVIVVAHAEVVAILAELHPGAGVEGVAAEIAALGVEGAHAQTVEDDAGLHAVVIDVGASVVGGHVCVVREEGAVQASGNAGGAELRPVRFRVGSQNFQVQVGRVAAVANGLLTPGSATPKALLPPEKAVPSTRSENPPTIMRESTPACA